jgi:uncharacterized membrane protein YbaN (DUF454 family)
MAVERDPEVPGAPEAGAEAPGSRVVASAAGRIVFVVAGFVCVGVGSIGVVVPGLPSTGFFVLAAACFARSSERFERWVLGLPGVGPAVRDYRAGLGMPRRAKVLAVSMIVVFSSISVVTLGSVPVRVGVAALGLCGVAFLLARVPTKTAPERRVT